MKSLKKTHTIIFKKEVKIGPHTATAVIELEEGKNKRGEELRSVCQVNTANEIVDEGRWEYEAGNISQEKMIEIIKSQGYSV